MNTNCKVASDSDVFHDGVSVVVSRRVPTPRYDLGKKGDGYGVHN